MGGGLGQGWASLSLRARGGARAGRGVVWLGQRAGQLSRSLLSVRAGGRAGGTAQVIAKKSGRGTRNSTPPIGKKLTSPRGGNASGGREPKPPMHLSLIFGLIVRQVDSEFG